MVDLQIEMQSIIQIETLVFLNLFMLFKNVLDPSVQKLDFDVNSPW